MLCNNDWSRNLIGPYHFFGISLRIFTRPCFSLGGVRRLGIRLNQVHNLVISSRLITVFEGVIHSNTIVILAKRLVATVEWLLSLSMEWTPHWDLCSHTKNQHGQVYFLPNWFASQQNSGSAFVWGFLYAVGAVKFTQVKTPSISFNTVK